jgi:hypothetical protein
LASEQWRSAKVPIRISGFAVPALIGVVVAVTSCGAPGTVKPAGSATRSASGVAAASSSAGAVPAGYKRVGGAAQGISLAVPASWVAVNLAKETIESAAKRTGLRGVSGSTLIQIMEALQKLHPVFVFDVKRAISGPQHFAPNLSAYCGASGVTDVGSAGVPFIKAAAAAEFQKVAATDVTQKDVEIGGVPGVETSYQLSSSSEGTLYGSQLEVLPKPDKACFVTLTAGNGQFPDNVLRVAAATAQFP